MPSPIAHSISGYAITRLWSKDASSSLKLPPRWLSFYGIFIAVMADLDFIPQILTGEPYHHRFTHSITFAIGVALVAWGNCHLYLSIQASLSAWIIDSGNLYFSSSTRFDYSGQLWDSATLAPLS